MKRSAATGAFAPARHDTSSTQQESARRLLEGLKLLWKELHIQRPMLKEGDFVALAWRLVESKDLNPHTNKKAPATPVTEAVRTLQAAIPVAIRNWPEQYLRHPDDVTLPHAIDRLIKLQEALHAFPMDWPGEPPTIISFNAWESEVLFTYPMLVKRCIKNGFNPAKPHSRDPLCRFLHGALGLAGYSPNPTIGALYQFLRRQLGQLGREDAGGPRAPAHPAPLVQRTMSENEAPQMIWKMVGLQMTRDDL